MKTPSKEGVSVYPFPVTFPSISSYMIAKA